MFQDLHLTKVQNLHLAKVQDLRLAKVQAGDMLIELDSELKSDVAKIMKDIIADSNDQPSTVSNFFILNQNILSYNNKNYLFAGDSRGLQAATEV